jgi:hypothetical protein
MTDEVLALAAALGGAEESDTLRLLCESAVEELTGMLREDVTGEDCGGAFRLAAAWMALAELGLTQDDGVESFTAGEVSIKKGDGQARRAALRLQARQVMRPYLKDEGFVFRGVKG